MCQSTKERQKSCGAVNLCVRMITVFFENIRHFETEAQLKKAFFSLHVRITSNFHSKFHENQTIRLILS